MTHKYRTQSTVYLMTAAADAKARDAADAKKDRETQAKLRITKRKQGNNIMTEAQKDIVGSSIVPTLPVYGSARCSSWVIVHKETGREVLETFDPVIASKINGEFYYVLNVLDYLTQLNREIKLGNPAYFSSQGLDVERRRS